VQVYKTTNIRKILNGISVNESFVEETLYENYDLVQVNADWNDVNCKRNRGKIKNSINIRRNVM
jgi:hypothetical protein